MPKLPKRLSLVFKYLKGLKPPKTHRPISITVFNKIAKSNQSNKKHKDNRIYQSNRGYKTNKNMIFQIFYQKIRVHNFV